MKTRRAIQLLLVLVVAGTFLGPVHSTGAGADDATALAGFQGLAAASGVHALYNIEGLLPLPPPVDIGAPDAYTTIVSGPTTFARSSVLDPGDLVANPSAVIGLLAAGAPLTLPAYPFRIQATSGVGAQSAESNPGPGLNARVSVSDTGSTAQATMPVVDAPAVLNFGTVTALATTKTDGSTITVKARTQTTGINLLGLVKIDSIVTDLTATSNGDGTKLTGGTTVLGATVMGQAVTIDGSGVHQKGKAVLPLPLAMLAGSLNNALKTLGLKITAPGTVKLSGGTTGQLASTGLRIDLSFSPTQVSLINTVLAAIPPIDNPIPGAPVGIEDVLAAAKANQLASIEIGRGLVSLNARQSEGFDASDTDALGFSTDALAPFTPSGDFPADGLGALPTIGDKPSTRPASTSDALPSPVGVGALILLALFAMPFVGELIARACGAVLATNDSEICPREER